MVIDRQKAQSELDIIVDKLNKLPAFEKVLNGEKGFDEWYFDEDPDIPCDIFIDYGETRMVIYIDGAEYVFKFNRSNHKNIDYNEQEYRIYQKAKAFGADEWLCPVIKMSIGCITVLCAPYLNVDDCEMSDLSFDHQLEQYCARNDIQFDELSDDARDEICDEVDRDYSDSTDGMIEFMQSIYGYEAVDTLQAFINEIGLNDLHCGNWGMDGERYYIIDYAGYNLVIQ